jgi:hypothetical protein
MDSKMSQSRLLQRSGNCEYYCYQVSNGMLLTLKQLRNVPCEFIGLRCVDE